MPIYEFRCPNGHLFEKFKRIDEPAPDSCEVCGESPVEIVLYPVAVHFKGSGFYSTDYGRGRKSGQDESTGSSDGATADTKDTKDAKDAKPEKKAAEA